MHRLLITLAISFITAYVGYRLMGMKEGMAATAATGSSPQGFGDETIADLGRRRPVNKVNDVAY